MALFRGKLSGIPLRAFPFCECHIPKDNNEHKSLWKGRGRRELRRQLERRALLKKLLLPSCLYILPETHLPSRRPDGLTMPIFFIFLRNVSGCTPSSSPAPPGPWIFPPVRSRAASICSRTTSSSERSAASLRNSGKPDAAPTDAAPVFSDRRASPRPAALSGLCSRTERDGTGASGSILHPPATAPHQFPYPPSSASPCSGAERPGTARSRTGWR